MKSNISTNNISTIFVWLAWLLAISIVAYGFNDFLKNKENPNQHVDSTISNNTIKVILKQNNYGHYVVNGSINNAPVTFLLDTGATNVSIPEHIANQLGLIKQNSYFVQTANGSAKVYKTQLDELKIGEINLYNVNASINPSFESNEILLGMSALKQIEFRQKGKFLTLIQSQY